jgi:hypothetical protein
MAGDHLIIYTIVKEYLDNRINSVRKYGQLVKGLATLNAGAT